MEKMPNFSEEEIPKDFSFQTSFEEAMPKAAEGQEVGIDFYLDEEGKYVAQMGEVSIVLSPEDAEKIPSGTNPYFGHGTVGPKNEKGEFTIDLIEE